MPFLYGSRVGNYMNSEYPLSIPLRERLEKLKQMKAIAKSFREENFSLPLDESKALKDLEDIVLECTNYGWQIDSMLEDDKISPYEFEQISTHLEKINDLTHKLAQNHRENAKLINKISSIYHTLYKLVQEVSYLSEDNDSGSTDNKYYSKEIGYQIEESRCCEVLEEMVTYFFEEEIPPTERNISKLERELLNSLEVISNIENGIILNVLYLKPPIVMDEILNSIEVLRILIDPIHTLIKNKYFREELKTAKIGLELISDDKSLNIGETIKIRGLFSSKKKRIPGLEEISEILDF